MHVTLANDLENAPYPIAIGHTKPDGTPSPLTLFMTFRQASEIYQRLEDMLAENTPWPVPHCQHGIPYDSDDICAECESK